MFFSKHATILRKFGFKLDQDGIMNRYLREKGGWQPHLDKTKDFIIKSAATKRTDCAVVLGSGWLLDVPINELAQQFQKVVLVDIIHPPQILHNIKKFNNVETISTDITGAMENVYETLKKSKKENNKLPLTEIDFAEVKLGETSLQSADFVVSVNLMNQLDILITDYIKQFKIYVENEIIDFKKKIQQHHLNILPKEKTCLITDYEEMIYNRTNLLEKTNQLIMIDLPEGKNKTHWQWNFDCSQTYYENCNTIFNVVAMDI